MDVLHDVRDLGPFVCTTMEDRSLEAAIHEAVDHVGAGGPRPPDHERSPTHQLPSPRNDMNTSIEGSAGSAPRDRLG